MLPLKVSAAFHSPLMHDAATGLKGAIDAVEQVAVPTCPVLSNISAEPLRAPSIPPS